MFIIMERRGVCEDDLEVGVRELGGYEIIEIIGLGRRMRRWVGLSVIVLGKVRIDIGDFGRKSVERRSGI